MERVICHYDMDAFYASVEMRENPQLKGQPFVVGGGVICTASYEARKFGVKSAMPVFQAKKLCPNLKILPVNIDLYSEVSETIHKLVKKITDKVEFIALDEGYIDLTNIIDKYPSKLYFAEKFKERILEITGLTCSIGIGYNKLSAKIASDMKKPAGISIFKNSHEFIQYIKDRPIREIPGVGKKLEVELLQNGIEKVQDIYNLSYSQLKKRYSASRALLLYYYSRGIDDSEVENERKAHSIGAENTYRYPLSSEEDLRRELEDIFQKVYDRLTEEKFYTKTLIIKLKYSDFTLITRSFSLTKHTNDRVTLYDMFENLFSEIEEFSNIRLAGLSFTNLTKNIYEQLQI